MIKLSFKNFLKGDYPETDKNGEPFQLYIVKHKKHTIYVGVSSQNIYNRWFSFSRSHILINIYGELLGNSSVGRYVIEHKGEITFQLLTLDDCHQFCKAKKIESRLDRYGVKDYEPIFIKLMKPRLNSTYNN